MSLAAITIDLDSIYCYQSIYGQADNMSDNRIYDIGLRRFSGLLDEFGIRSTLFAVGQDMKMGKNGQMLKELASTGHEIANHSMTHDYALTKLPDDQMLDEVKRSKEAIEAAIERPIEGFRAPGYTVNETLLQIIEATGHRYDSSVFPCYPYYITKLGVLGVMGLVGGKSRSIIGGPQVLLAPKSPYRPDRKHYWKRGHSALWELPITTSPVLRFPLLGSFIVLMGESWLKAMLSMMERSTKLIVAEFHGMDFMDAERDELASALAKQPDVRVSWNVKRKLFRELFYLLQKKHRLVTLSEATDLQNS